ncbi:MAG: DNA-directed DNA polymerase [Candidatus Hydrothermarchaeales archaeon]
MDKIRGTLLDIDYITKDGKAIIRLFLKNQEYNIAIDDSFSPYLYVLPRVDARKVEKEIKGVGEEIKEITHESRSLFGKRKEVLKVVFQHPQDVPKLRDLIRDLDVVEDIFEHDLLFFRRYLIDKHLTPSAVVEIHGKGDGEFKVEKISSIEEATQTPLTIMAFDIEVYNPKGAPREKKDPITMISLASNTGIKKVLTWKAVENAPDYVEVLNDETEILTKFMEIVKKGDIDVLMGYNTDQFDFPYIEKRCKKLGIKLILGRDESEVKLQTSRGMTKAVVKGRPHVDLYPIIRRSIRLSSYVLENVVLEILGKDKEKIPGDVMHKYWDGGGADLRKFFEYSMEDALVVLELGEKFLPLYIELSRIVKMPLFDVSRMTTGQLVEWLLIREAHNRGELVPNGPRGSEYTKRAVDTYVGGYVLEPKKGLVEDIVVFDFRSLYPSVIVTHNIDPTTISMGKCENSPPDFDYCFSQDEEGFLPAILGSIITRRMEIKDEMGKTSDQVKLKMLDVQQQALKLLANSFYGYMGYPRARWYKKECAESVTSFARMYIKSVMKKAEEEYGFEVVYGDTDSLFIVAPEEKKNETLRFMSQMNHELPGTIKLEYEGFYKRGVFVTKKRYALIDGEGNMTIKGLEFVRRDWAPITRKTQQKVLEAILKHGSKEMAAEIVRDTIKRLIDREVSLEEVTLSTQLTKRIESYKNRGPHVLAAEKLRATGAEVRPGNVIRYIITKGGKLISERAEPIVSETTIEDYDPEYYINNQILPTVSRILESLGYSIVDLKKDMNLKLTSADLKSERKKAKKKQKTLAQWF